MKKVYQVSRVVAIHQDFATVKEFVQADRRGRLTLGTQVLGSKVYRVMRNPSGQILLDPVVAIPERELWLHQNSAAIASLQQGLEQAAAGELHDLGSFAEYANLDVEDD